MGRSVGEGWVDAWVGTKILSGFFGRWDYRLFFLSGSLIFFFFFLFSSYAFFFLMKECYLYNNKKAIRNPDLESQSRGRSAQGREKPTLNTGGSKPVSALERP